MDVSVEICNFPLPQGRHCNRQSGHSGACDWQFEEETMNSFENQGGEPRECGHHTTFAGTDMYCKKAPGHDGEHDYIGPVKPTSYVIPQIVPDDPDREMTGDDLIDEALRALSLPVDDTMGKQLLVFVRAMRINIERNAELGGELWKEVDTDDTAHHIRHKAQRLYHRESAGGFDPDDALDLINYAAFYLRQKEGAL